MTVQEIQKEIDKRIEIYRKNVGSNDPGERIISLNGLLDTLHDNDNELENVFKYLNDNCPELERLEISGKPFIPKIPDTLKDFKSLTTLIIKDSTFETIPEVIKELKSLKSLRIENNKNLKKLPSWIVDFNQLNVLNLKDCNISYINERDIEILGTKLKSIDVQGNTNLSVFSIRALKTHFKNVQGQSKRLKLSEDQSLNLKKTDDFIMLLDKIENNIDSAKQSLLSIYVVTFTDPNKYKYNINGNQESLADLIYELVEITEKELSRINKNDKLYENPLNLLFEIVFNLYKHEELREACHKDFQSKGIFFLFAKHQLKDKLSDSHIENLTKLNPEDRNNLLLFLNTLEVNNKIIDRENHQYAMAFDEAFNFIFENQGFYLPLIRETVNQNSFNANIAKKMIIKFGITKRLTDLLGVQTYDNDLNLKFQNIATKLTTSQILIIFEYIEKLNANTRTPNNESVGDQVIKFIDELDKNPNNRTKIISEMRNHCDRIELLKLGLSDEQIRQIFEHPKGNEFRDFLIDKNLFSNTGFNKVYFDFLIQEIFQLMVDPDPLLKKDTILKYIRETIVIKNYDYTFGLACIFKIKLQRSKINHNADPFRRGFVCAELKRMCLLLDAYIKPIDEQEANTESEIIQKDIKYKKYINRFKLLVRSKSLYKMDDESFDALIKEDPETIDTSILKQLVEFKISRERDGILGLSNLGLTDDEFNHIVLPILKEAIEKGYHLSSIDLSHNRLSKFPSFQSINEYQKITGIDLKFNRITEFPEDKKDCENYEHIIIASNLITDLPPYFMELENLKKMDIQHNSLSYDAIDILKFKTDKNFAYTLERKMDLSLKLPKLFSKTNPDGSIDHSEANEMYDFITNLSNDCDVFSERKLMNMNRSVRVILTEFVCSLQLNDNDPNTPIFKEIIKRELRDLKADIEKVIASKQEQQGSNEVTVKDLTVEELPLRIFEIQSHTGSCDTPLKDFLRKAEIKRFRQNQSHIDLELMSNFVTYEAIKNQITTDPYIKSLLPAKHGELAEMISWFVNRVMAPNAEMDPNSIFIIRGNRGRIASSSHDDFGKRLIDKEKHKELIFAVAALVCTDASIEQAKTDNNFTFDIDTEKLQKISDSYLSDQISMHTYIDQLSDKMTALHSKYKTSETDLSSDDRFYKYIDYPGLKTELKELLAHIEDPETLKIEYDAFIENLEKEIKEMVEEFHQQQEEGTNQSQDPNQNQEIYPDLDAMTMPTIQRSASSALLPNTATARQVVRRSISMNL